MKSSARSFLVAAGVVVTGGSVLWLATGDAAKTTVAWAEGSRPVAQSADQRTWRPVEPKRLWHVEAGDIGLYGPLDIKSSADGHVFVIDYGDLSVKELSPAGKLLRRYGGLRGQGPGELLSITDLVVTEGEVWIADDTAGTILVYDREGRHLRRIRFDVPPYRVVRRPDGNLLLMMPPGSVDMFGLYSGAGNPQATFGKLTENQKENLIALDGWIEDDEQEGFVYTGLYAGLLARFDEHLRPVFLRETIDPTPIPKIVRTERRSWVDWAAEISSQKISVSEGRIFLLSLRNKGGRKVGAIDSYRVDDGEYLFSFGLPTSYSRAIVQREHVLTATDSSVSKWFLGEGWMDG